jgi:hypothetical protein
MKDFILFVALCIAYTLGVLITMLPKTLPSWTIMLISGGIGTLLGIFAILYNHWSEKREL